jgi:integrase
MAHGRELRIYPRLLICSDLGEQSANWIGFNGANNNADLSNGARRRLRLHEKGGKEHEMPVHHLLEQILNGYVETAGLRSGQPLFQSVSSAGTAVTGRALNRYNAWAAIRKRAKAAGFLTPVGCHTWRATGITIYLENDGRLEHAQQMAGHESPRTTELYDRTKDEITLSEVERIRL